MSSVSNNISKFAFLALLLLLAAVLLKLSSSFIHAIVLGMLIASAMFPFHLSVNRLLRKTFRLLRKLPFAFCSPSQVIGKTAAAWQEAIYKKQAAQPEKPPGCSLRWQLALAGLLQRTFLASSIELTRNIIIRRKKLAAALSVALLLLLVAMPLVFLFHSAFMQGRQLLNKANHALQSGELSKKLYLYYEKESVQNAWQRIQASKTGRFILQESAEFLGSPDLFHSLEGKPSHAADLEVELLEEQLHQDEDETAPEQLSGDDEADDFHLLFETLIKNLLLFSRRFLIFLQSFTIKAISATSSLLFSIFLMVIVLFFLFYQGPYLVELLKQVGPFAADDYEQICRQIVITSRTVFVGILGAASVQGLASLLGYWLVGLPALFLAGITAACSIIPFVGTSLVWLPATVYLYYQGQGQKAVFLAAWGLILVANIDGLVRPWLMSGGKAKLSFGLLFFAILGGLRTYGLIGLVYGPMLLGLFITSIDIFAQKYKRG
ncbi:MAG: AI-2E family transporter [Lentisphaerae bacterium]|nr:AI-2E family transporter [Lentisphaerota bacterium]